MANIISVKNLNGGYENNKIFSDLNIDFNSSRFIAIAGPNGSGKSTFLKYLIKELKAQDSCIFLNNKELNTYKQIDLAKEISFVGQNSKTEYEFTVKEFVQLGRFCHKDENTNYNIALKALETVGIANLRDKLITQISGGEMQLALVARAICQESPIMALDEPINNLDPSHELHLLTLLKKLTKEGKTVICVLHDLNAVLNYCDDCILLKNGTVLASGTANEVLTQENIKKAYGIESQIIDLSHGHKLLTFCCIL